MMRTVLLLVAALPLVTGATDLAGLPRASVSLWDTNALAAPPRTFAVDLPCSNEYGRVAGVEPVFVEGEPYRGRPTRVFAWWGLPEGASAAHPVPAMVLVHGGGGTAFARWVKTWNDRGYAAIAMDTCGKIPQGERDGRPHNTHPWSGPGGWGLGVAQIVRPVRDQWTYHAVAAVLRCHSFLRARPEVDASRVGLTGISWGGYLTSIAGSVDSRFRFAAPVYGCGFYDSNPAWDSMNGDVAKRNAWYDLWDPKQYLSAARIPFLWCCGTNDKHYPLDCVRMSYGLLDAAVPLSLSLKYKMPHAHPPAGDPPEITALADSLLKGGRPPVEVTHTELKDGVLAVAFDSHGRTAVGAELLATCSTNQLLMDREWTRTRIADFDPKGRLAVPVPASAVMFFVNVITDDGLVASSRIFERPPCRILVGNARTAYRDPAAVWVGGRCRLFFTLVETEADGGVHSFVATSESDDLVTWSRPRKLTPKSDLDYSSPGNVVKDGDDYVLCFQSYPRPGNRDDGKVRYADRTARLFTMRTKDFATWTAPELLRVKGPDVAEADMGRMIDPYLVQARNGGWLCFYKQNGASFSRSPDLKHWEPVGRTEAGENVCVVEEGGRYLMMHSPKNGLRFKESTDLIHWRDLPDEWTFGQRDWPWAKGRLTAGFLLDGRQIPQVGKWLLFYHGSGPRTEDAGDFDRNASIGLAILDKIP